MAVYYIGLTILSEDLPQHLGTSILEGSTLEQQDLYTGQCYWFNFTHLEVKSGVLAFVSFMWLLSYFLNKMLSVKPDFKVNVRRYLIRIILL